MGLSASSRRSCTDTAPGTSRAIPNTLAPPLPAKAAVLSTPARRLELELAPADRGDLAAAFTRDDLRAATGFDSGGWSTKGFKSSSRAVHPPSRLQAEDREVRVGSKSTLSERQLLAQSCRSYATAKMAVDR
jgi:hypothetical protein